MMASCILLGIERLTAKTDAMLLMTVVAAMGAMARAYLSLRGEPRGALDGADAWLVAAVFWRALAVGVLLKGPLIVMVVGLAAVALIVVDRSAFWLMALKPLPGVLWFAVLVLPWFIAIMGRAASSSSPSRSGKTCSARSSGPESHGAPPGYYFILFWLSFWPGATLAACEPAVGGGASRSQVPGLAGAVGRSSWWSQTAALRAAALSRGGDPDCRRGGCALASRRPVLVWGTMWWFVVPTVAGLIGIVMLAVIGRQFGFLVWPVFGFAAFLAFLAWRLYEADGPEHALLRAVAAATLTAIGIFALVIPSLGQLFPSQALARVLRDSGCRAPMAAAVGYQEPSLVFLIGTATRLTDTYGAAEFLRGGECRFAFVEAPGRAFAQRAEAIGLRFQAGPRRGFNISTDSRSPSRSSARQVPREHQRRAEADGLMAARRAVMDAPTWRNTFRCSDASQRHHRCRHGAPSSRRRRRCRVVIIAATMIVTDAAAVRSRRPRRSGDHGLR